MSQTDGPLGQSQLRTNRPRGTETGFLSHTDMNLDEEARSLGSEHMAQISAYAPEMYTLLQAALEEQYRSRN